MKCFGHSLSNRALQWCSFDAGKWALTSVTLSTLLPFAFKQAMGADPTAPMAWSGISAIFTLCAAFMGPFVGILADMFEKRKFLLFALLLFEIFGVLAFVFIGFNVHWFLALLFYGLAFLANILSLTLYNAMIMFMDDEDDLAMVSVWGTAFANLGAGILMVALGMLTLSPLMLNYHYYVICTIVASIFCLILSLPMWIYFPEPPSGHTKVSSLTDTIDEMKLSIQAIVSNKELLKLVIALFLFSDAANTMWTVHLVYGATMGIAGIELFGAQVVGRLIAVPFCIMWGYFATIFTSRTNTLISMGVGVVCCSMLAFLTNTVEYWILTVLLAASGTGMFIFTRVLMADLTPPRNAGQNFGFLAFLNKLSGFAGPALFSLLGYIIGSARAGFFALAILALFAMVLLMQVDIQEATMLLQNDPIRDSTYEPALNPNKDTTTKPYQNASEE